MIVMTNKKETPKVSDDWKTTVNPDTYHSSQLQALGRFLEKKDELKPK